jgi:hypothetical protein
MCKLVSRESLTTLWTQTAADPQRASHLGFGGQCDSADSYQQINLQRTTCGRVAAGSLLT